MSGTRGRPARPRPGGDRVKIATVADITDKAGTLACRGAFEWSIRRVSPAPAA
ncbi:MAG TPA: hypothetical protein VFX25_30100 [Streptosporangiaceae bacterium]|nr:hypothetical protein [Streptosporangiaceae bacterium]